MGKCLFVTGTGTDVGKTYVTALIVKKLRQSGRNAGYYKAAISGADVAEGGELLAGDALLVKEMAGLDAAQADLVSYVYREAVSPHLAARLNHCPIEWEKVSADFQKAKAQYDFLTMEGSGGIICPLRWDEKEHFGLDDMIRRLELAVLVIVPAGLGSINAAVLTVEHLLDRHIPIKGIALNNFHPGDVMEEDNRLMIETITGVRVIATVYENGDDINISADDLAALYE